MLNIDESQNYCWPTPMSEPRVRCCFVSEITVKLILHTYQNIHYYLDTCLQILYGILPYIYIHNHHQYYYNLLYLNSYACRLHTHLHLYVVIETYRPCMQDIG